MFRLGLRVITYQNTRIMNKEMNLQNVRMHSLNIADVRRSADMWWKTLNHETRVKYATEQLNKRGQVFRYNNDGLISGFTLSDVVELFRHYALHRNKTSSFVNLFCEELSCVSMHMKKKNIKIKNVQFLY